MGFYGIVLVVMGLVAYAASGRAETGDVSANLWAGMGLTVVAVGFAPWSRLRPVVVNLRPDDTDDVRDRDRG